VEYREMDQLERVAVIAVAAASAASCSDLNSTEDLGHLAYVNQTLVQINLIYLNQDWLI
jgi:hypothetical protein